MRSLRRPSNSPSEEPEVHGHHFVEELGGASSHGPGRLQNEWDDLMLPRVQPYACVLRPAWQQNRLVVRPPWHWRHAGRDKEVDEESLIVD